MYVNEIRVQLAKNRSQKQVQERLREYIILVSLIFFSAHIKKCSAHLKREECLSAFRSGNTGTDCTMRPPATQLTAERYQRKIHFSQSSESFPFLLASHRSSSLPAPEAVYCQGSAEPSKLHYYIEDTVFPYCKNRHHTFQTVLLQMKFRHSYQIGRAHV